MQMLSLTNMSSAKQGLTGPGSLQAGVVVIRLRRGITRRLQIFGLSRVLRSSAQR